jgi:hypothetical protein
LIADCDFGFSEALILSISREPAEDRFKAAYTIVTLEAGASTQKFVLRPNMPLFGSSDPSFAPDTEARQILRSGSSASTYRYLPRCPWCICLHGSWFHTEPLVVWFCVVEPVLHGGANRLL